MCAVLQSNVILCVVAWLSSIILTIVCIWKSGVEEFDSTLKLLLTMGEFFQTIMALYLAKTVRDSDIARRVAHTDWVSPTLSSGREKSLGSGRAREQLCRHRR